MEAIPSFSQNVKSPLQLFLVSHQLPQVKQRRFVLRSEAFANLFQVASYVVGLPSPVIERVPT